MGGGFGNKDESRLGSLAALAAREAGRPVRIEYSRVEEFIAGRNRQETDIDVTIGVDASGAPVAIDMRGDDERRRLRCLRHGRDAPHRPGRPLPLYDAECALRRHDRLHQPARRRLLPRASARRWVTSRWKSPSTRSRTSLASTLSTTAWRTTSGPRASPASARRRPTSSRPTSRSRAASRSRATRCTSASSRAPSASAGASVDSPTAAPSGAGTAWHRHGAGQLQRRRQRHVQAEVHDLARRPRRRRCRHRRRRARAPRRSWPRSWPRRWAARMTNVEHGRWPTRRRRRRHTSRRAPPPR